MSPSKHTFKPVSIGAPEKCLLYCQEIMSHLSLGVQESIIGLALCVKRIPLGLDSCACNKIYARCLLPVFCVFGGRKKKRETNDVVPT